MSGSNSRPVRYVVFHRPSPKWKAGIDSRELDGFAADPAVQSGLLVYEIRPWLTAMEHELINRKEKP